MPFYAVKRGKKPGVYEKWNECQQQTIDFPGAQFKKFDSREEAEAFVKGGGNPKGKTSTSSGSSADGKKTDSKKRAKDSSTKKAAKKEDVSAEESEDSESDTDDSPPPTKRVKSTVETKSAGSAKGDGEQVYVSAACFNIGKKPVAGVGIFWTKGSSNNLSEALEISGKPTINRAVIHAAVRLCQQIKQLGNSKVVINSGHANLVQSMSSWIKKWKEKDWKTSTGADVANKDDLQELVKASEGLAIEWNLVDKDSDELAEADQLAKDGARKS